MLRDHPVIERIERTGYPFYDVPVYEEEKEEEEE